MSGYVENFNIGTCSDTINVLNVTLYVVVLLIELYLFIPLTVILIVSEGHHNV